jgi:hypothetical protein
MGNMNTSLNVIKIKEAGIRLESIGIPAFFFIQLMR